MTDIENLLTGVAQALPEALAGINWGSLDSSFDNLKESLGGAFEAVFGDIDLSTVDGVKEAIQTVVDLLAGLGNASAGVIDGMQPLFVALGTIADKFGEMDQAGQTAAGQILGFGKSVHEITGFLSGATDALSGMANGLLLLGGGSALNSITNLVSKLGPAGLSGALTKVLPLLGKAGLVGAAGAAGYAVGTVLNEGIDAAVESLTGGDNKSLGGLVYDWIHDDEAQVEPAVQDLIAPINDIPQTVQMVARDVAEIGWQVDADGNVKKFTDEIKKNLQDIATGGEFDKLKNQYIALGNSPEIAAAMANIEMETGRIPKAVKDAADKTKTESDKLITDLAKISSDERIKTMKFTVDLNVAKIKADAKTAEAVIENLGKTITSTNALVGDLAGSYAGLSGGDFQKKWQLEDLMGDANDRAEAATKKQLKLTDAQIDYMNAKTSALKSGDSLIKISGDGLAPELEAFMWKILETIQVRAAEDQSAFLLGI